MEWQKVMQGKGLQHTKGTDKPSDDKKNWECAKSSTTLSYLTAYAISRSSNSFVGVAGSGGGVGSVGGGGAGGGGGGGR